LQLFDAKPVISTGGANVVLGVIFFGEGPLFAPVSLGSDVLSLACCAELGVGLK
jgi:hypothetical protein